MSYIDRIREAKSSPLEQETAIGTFLLLLSIEMNVRKTLSYLEIENLIEVVCR